MGRLEFFFIMVGVLVGDEGVLNSFFSERSKERSLFFNNNGEIFIREGIISSGLLFLILVFIVKELVGFILYIFWSYLSFDFDFSRKNFNYNSMFL